MSCFVLTATCQSLSFCAAPNACRTGPGSVKDDRATKGAAAQPGALIWIAPPGSTDTTGSDAEPTEPARKTKSGALSKPGETIFLTAYC